MSATNVYTRQRALTNRSFGVEGQLRPSAKRAGMHRAWLSEPSSLRGEASPTRETSCPWMRWKIAAKEEAFRCSVQYGSLMFDARNRSCLINWEGWSIWYFSWVEYMDVKKVQNFTFDGVNSSKMFVLMWRFILLGRKKFALCGCVVYIEFCEGKNEKQKCSFFVNFLVEFF